MNKEEKRRKLEAIVQLKTEHGIGALDAWRYIKSQEEHEVLRTRWIARLQQHNIPHIPGLREVTNLETNLYHTFYNLLENAAVIRAAELEWKHQPQSLDWMMENFFYDQSRLVVEFYKNFINNKNEEEAFSATFNHFMTSNYPYVIKVKIPKEHISFAEFRKRDEYLLDLTSEGAGEDCSSPEQQEARLKDAREDLEMPLMVYPLKSMTTDEMSYLYKLGGGSSSAYGRAKRERTLHRIETERRIALGTMILNMSNEDEEETVDETLRSTIASLEMLIKHLDGPRDAPLRENFNYTLRAIKKNYSWLKTVLER